MDKKLIKKITILSALAGAILAVAAVIPFVVKLAVFILMTCVCLPVIIYLRKSAELEIFTVKESIMVGSLCGFVAYIVFSAVFLPLVFIISYFFAVGYLGGLVLMLKLSNFGLILMFTVFISIVSVIFNAFSSLLYYYITSSLETVKDDKTFKLK